MARKEGLSTSTRRSLYWLYWICGTLIIVLAFLVKGYLANPPSTDHDRTMITPSAGTWSILRHRPLHLPVFPPRSSCPTAHGRIVSQDYGLVLGSDTVYALGFSANGILKYADAASFERGKSSWGGQRVVWIIQADYQGPVLIRGRQIDGPNELLFNGGFDQERLTSGWAMAPLLKELRLIASGDSSTSWVGWSSYLRLQAPGCYAYQVDGLAFTETIIFRAVPVYRP